MQLTGNGVQAPSDIYFYAGSELAKRIYFHILCTGHYCCNSDYLVQRNHFDSFLMMQVEKGSGFLTQNGKHYPLKQGDFVLLDCYCPHTYGTTKGWEITWLHFDGVLARDFYEQATRSGIVFHAQHLQGCTDALHQIFHAFHTKRKVSEAFISKQINDILTEFILLSTRDHKNLTRAETLDRTLTYMAQHATEPLCLADLAARAHLSVFHFCRMFQKETGFTPHEYLIEVRMNLAKYDLTMTQLTMKEIAYHCGFGSEASFCTSFKKRVGMRPTAYRQSETQDK